MNSRRMTAASSIAIMAACGAAFGAELIFIGDGIGITDLSENGRVAVGNTISDGAYETWRWVHGDPQGWYRLGLATVPVTGGGAGSPDVSHDGTRVSATILGGLGGGSRDVYETAGIWTLGLGWTELFPPLPVDCISVDGAFADAWGLSGDGSTLVGLYWRSTNGGQNGGTRPCATTLGSPTVAFPTLNNDSGRLNACNVDGTIVAGWERTPTGPWRPTAWRNGVKHVLTDTPVACQAEGMNADGSVIVGSTYNAAAARVDPARWDWNGSSYVETMLPVLPGTPQTWIARVWASGVTDDGSTVVGVNRFQNNGPYSLVKCFVWTQQDGIRDVIDVAAEAGVPFPADFMVVSIEISPDGSAIGGIGINTAETLFLDYKSFILRFTPLPECVGDVTGDGQTNISDFNILAGNFGAGPGAALEDGDLSGDGFVNIADFNIVAGAFGCTSGGD